MIFLWSYRGYFVYSGMNRERRVGNLVYTTPILNRITTKGYTSPSRFHKVLSVDYLHAIRTRIADRAMDYASNISYEHPSGLHYQVALLRVDVVSQPEYTGVFMYILTEMFDVYISKPFLLYGNDKLTKPNINRLVNRAKEWFNAENY